MAHVYQVTMNDGARYDVTTERHHDQVPEATFRQHLLQIIRDSVPNIISGVVVGFVLKGHK